MLMVDFTFTNKALHDLNGFTHAARARYNSLITARCSLIDEQFFPLRVTLNSAREWIVSSRNFFCTAINSRAVKLKCEKFCNHFELICRSGSWKVIWKSSQFSQQYVWRFTSWTRSIGTSALSEGYCWLKCFRFGTGNGWGDRNAWFRKAKYHRNRKCILKF